MTRNVSMDLAAKITALNAMPVLDGCPPEEVEAIAHRAHVLFFEDGDVIIPEGEEGLGFYFITSGRARVIRDDASIATLRTGDYFGEVSLIEGSARNATVIAEGGTTCIGILRSFFRPLLARNPRLALRILEEEQRRVEPESID
jgi:CRP-like cAMP-binding protein